MEALRSGQAYIDGVIGNVSSAPLSYQKMVLSSAALSTLFAGDYAKAADYFLRYFRMETENQSDLFWSFRSAYNDVRNWSIARSPEILVTPIESVDFLYVK